MKKILVLVLLFLGVAAQGQFVFSGTKSTAKMDTLQLKATRLQITNSSKHLSAYARVSGDSLYFGDATGEHNISGATYNPAWTGYGTMTASGAMYPSLLFKDLDITTPDYSGVGFIPTIDTHTIGQITGSSATSGITIRGFTANTPTTSALSFGGYLGVPATNGTAITFTGYKSDGGTSRTNLGATENLIKIFNGSVLTSKMTGGGHLSVSRLTSVSTDSTVLTITNNYTGTSLKGGGIFVRTYGLEAHGTYNATYNKDSYGTFNLTADTGSFGTYNSTSGVSATGTVSITSGKDSYGVQSQTSGLRSIPFYGVSSSCDTLLYLIKTATPKFYVTGTGNVVSSGQLKTLHVTAALTDAIPTAAELNSASGLTASTAGAGYQFFVKDTDGTALVYRVYSDGTDWWYNVLTKAL